MATVSYSMAFSFNTPASFPVLPDGGSPEFCGRAVFGDLHVMGDPIVNDKQPTPAGCGTGQMSSQEEALEFMLFDLSSCVVPDSAPIPKDGALP